jgi:cysteinyl-tRNA synthetase
MVRYQGEKMSKSLGNLVFPRELFRDHEPAAVRLALLAHHWRSAWEWDAAELKEAAERLSAWRLACGHPRTPTFPFDYAPPPGDPPTVGRGAARPGLGDPPTVGRGAARPGAGDPPSAGRDATRLPDEVDAALADDLDTPAALAVGDELAERGDGPGVAATAAVLGVELAHAAR